LQSRRWGAIGAGSLLGTDLDDIADRLGQDVKQGGVALFLGAGVSRAAGLPTWQDLLTRLAPEELRSSPEFQDWVDYDPPRGASRLKEVLGNDFDGALRAALSTDSYGLTHGLLASLRVGEVLTTNIDQLYELAAVVPLLPKKLSVLPWKRMPDRPPWLLKMHGDLDNADLVFTEEDYTNFEKDHGALGAVLQALLITRHLVFVGYSLRDKNFVDLAKEVATTLVLSGAPHTLIGTVLTLTDAPGDSSTPWGDSFQTFSVGDNDPEITNADGRRLEIFLDRVAWRAAEDEWSWILDDRYWHLLEDGKERTFAEALKDLQIPKAAKWNALRELLTDYGLKTSD
jgi:NAD-dependent SIR2 family protein deacetylase